MILETGELYSTVDSAVRRQKKDGLPIRCYRSGSQWAWLYADGRLESNLPDGEIKQGVTAVVEDAERGLLVCGPEGAVDYRFNRNRPVSDEEFVRKMMERFLQADDCEVQRTQFMNVVIRSFGNVEVV